MSVWPLPRITFQELSSIEEKRPVALLTTNDVWSVLGSQLALPVVIQAEPERYNRDLFDYLADHLPTSVQAVYAVGRGAPVEAAKVVASRNHRPLVIIPSALDSDKMLTPFAEVVEEQNGSQKRLVRVETGPAAEVIVDWDVIQAAPHELRGAGIVDVLSIVTGLLDWRFAAQKGKNPIEQRFTPWAASVAAGLASQAIKSAAAIGQGQLDALQTLLDLLMIVVQLNNQLGHQRAQEGCEHYLGQILAVRADPKLSHAEMIAPCILFVSALHGQDPAALRDAMQNAGVRLDQLRATDVRLTLDELPNYIGEYNFPYSMLNETDPASETVTQALETAGLAIEDYTWQLPDEPEPPAESTAEITPAEAAASTPSAPESTNPNDSTAPMPNG